MYVFFIDKYSDIFVEMAISMTAASALLIHWE